MSQLSNVLIVLQVRKLVGRMHLRTLVTCHATKSLGVFYNTARIKGLKNYILATLSIKFLIQTLFQQAVAQICAGRTK